MSAPRILLTLVLVGVLLVALYVAGAWLRLYGEHEGPGELSRAVIPKAVVDARVGAQQRAARALAIGQPKLILFGDLHVHTTFSTDAFLWSLPMLQGEGAHPIGDACDYARFCSALDFWSINDHAEASTPRRWQETKDMIRQCNAVAGDIENPNVAAFLGWEWSQVGRVPEDHYGHKNVIFLGLEEDEVPTRVIGAAGVATAGLRGGVQRLPRLLPLRRARPLLWVLPHRSLGRLPSADRGARLVLAHLHRHRLKPPSGQWLEVRGPQRPVGVPRLPGAPPWPDAAGGA